MHFREYRIPNKDIWLTYKHVTTLWTTASGIWNLYSLVYNLISYFECEILKSIPGNNQYWALRVKFLAQVNNSSPLQGSNSRLSCIHWLLVTRTNHCAPTFEFFVRLTAKSTTNDKTNLHILARSSLAFHPRSCSASLASA